MVNTEKPVSEFLEDVIDIFSNVRTTYKRATQDLELHNSQLQDLDHYIEFDKHSGPEMTKLCKLLKQTRNLRREDKEAIEVLTPVVNWLNSGHGRETVKQLERLLGETRKLERLQQTRAYAIRTDILKDFISNTHILSQNDRFGDDSIG